MRTSYIAALTLGLMISGGAVTSKADSTMALKETFAKTPVIEVPAKSADLVAQAAAAERNAVAVSVVKAAIQKSPTVAPAIVGAIAHRTPATAPVVAATASAIQPKQVRLIVQAAAAAAPAQAGEIVKAVCKALPASYREVALVVAEAAPKSAKEILAALAEAMPEIKLPLETAIASYHGNVPSVIAVLDRVATTQASQPTVADSTPAPGRGAVRGPAVSPPYIPLSSTPTYTPPGGGVVPSGGRDYAAP